MNRMRVVRAALGWLLAATWVGVPAAGADVVIDANVKATEIAVKLQPTPVAVRALAIVQVSVYEAVNAITGRYEPSGMKIEPAPGASVEAAVAAATHAVLVNLVPAQRDAAENDYRSALTSIADGKAKADGIAVGEKAAATVLAACAKDGADAPENYQPATSPGVYVPTALPAVPQWGKRKPWVMTRGDQFRPGPPPSLTSETWKRDLAEIKAVGGKTSTVRTEEQTAIARFWEATGPTLYWPLAREVAALPGRDLSENARFFAEAGMAMDDALIGVFEAKYAYGFWRPVTAIRNAAPDTRDLAWKPFIDTPMHPEYPCAHCILSAALGTVLEAEVGGGTMPTLSTSSPTAGGAVRSWKSVGEFEQEVANARVYDGVHYRNSTEVGTAMGKKIGELVAKSQPKRK